MQMYIVQYASPWIDLVGLDFFCFQGLACYQNIEIFTVRFV
jgi:hypothetical protein